jgi:hypothetical protein
VNQAGGLHAITPADKQAVEDQQRRAFRYTSVDLSQYPLKPYQPTTPFPPTSTRVVRQPDEDEIEKIQDKLDGLLAELMGVRKQAITLELQCGVHRQALRERGAPPDDVLLHPHPHWIDYLAAEVRRLRPRDQEHLQQLLGSLSEAGGVEGQAP